MRNAHECVIDEHRNTMRWSGEWGMGNRRFWRRQRFLVLGAAAALGMIYVIIVARQFTLTLN